MNTVEELGLSHDEAADIKVKRYHTDIAIVLKAFSQKPDALTTFPSQIPQVLSEKQAKKRSPSNPESAIIESQQQVSSFLKMMSEVTGLSFEDTKLFDIKLNAGEVKQIFPEMYRQFPSLFLDSGTTDLRQLILKISDQRLGELVAGEWIKKGLEKGREFFSEIDFPHEPINYTISSPDESQPINLSVAEHRPLVNTNDDLLSEIHFTLDKRLLTLTQGEQSLENAPIEFMGTEVPDQNFVPFIFEVVALHEEIHAVIAKLIGDEHLRQVLTVEDRMGSAETLANAIEEAITVTYELMYAMKRYEECTKNKDLVGQAAFKFFMRARLNSLRSKKDRYYYGRQVLAKKWKKTQQSPQNLFSLLKQVDFAKASEIVVDDEPFIEIMIDPLNKIPLKSS